jgi:hypothetical protein
MNWESSEQIAAFFDLREAAEGDLGALRRAVVKKMASIHPDSNESGFPDFETEELWHQLHSAKAFLDESLAMSKPDTPQNQMIPISQVKELVKIFSQVRSNSIESRLSSLKAEARGDARSRGMVPRIGSGAFAAICAFLFAFPSSAKDNPLIGHWVQTTAAQWILLIATAYSAAFFLMTWTRERRQEELTEFLSSEEGMRQTMIRMIERRARSDGHPRRFTLPEWTKQLMPNRHHEYFSPWLALIGGRNISRSLADKIATLHVERMAERSVIIELPQKGFDRVFEISPATYEELVNQRRE